MKESKFQSDLRKDIISRFPGSQVFKQDPLVTHQGIPDLLVLNPRGRWAMLETKRAKNAADQVNQEHWIKHYDEMSYAARVHPGNKDEVLSDLDRIFNS